MKLSVTRIVILYSIVGILWIILGDYFLFSVHNRTSGPLELSLIKGLVYVFLTAAGLYFLLSINEKQLKKISREYKRLFHTNPNPMWIYDRESLEIMAVNTAAISQYGYSYDEFLNMRISDLRSDKEQHKLRKAIKSMGMDFRDSGIWIHKDKSGKEKYTQIYGNGIRFRSRDASFVVAINVDEQVKNRMKILDQNKKLKEIAHFQAHDLRGPVSSILGLVSIFDKANTDPHLNMEILSKLEESAIKLDSIVREIVSKAETVDDLD